MGGAGLADTAAALWTLQCPGAIVAAVAGPVSAPRGSASLGAPRQLGLA